MVDHVVLLDGNGRAVGTLPKADAHHQRTPLHLAFSCHVVGRGGRVLLAKRAPSKATWPGTWTNACCGHPQEGETLRDAVVRRVREELGLRVTNVAVALPDFTYRAVMDDGTVEHERCPVVVAEVAGVARPEPSEVADIRWQVWDDLVARADGNPGTLSPWSVDQIAELRHLARTPSEWLGGPSARRAQGLLDRTVEVGRAVDPPVAAGQAVVARALEPVAVPLRGLLATFLDEKASLIAGIDPVLAELTDEVRGLVDAGGKRLRPAFVHWGHRATGEDTMAGVLHSAAAVELLHTFALVHDDVMDRSARRRGRPTVHTSLADAHRAADRLGDAGWFGASAAILAGDLTFVWADELLDAAPLPAAAVDRARRVFTTLRQEVIAGQHLDLLLAADPAADEHRARRVALLKSARYTVTRPLLLGAALADPTRADAVRPALTAYGDAVGLAFQLRDDILGLFGDPGLTGKSDLDDLREGKRTVLMMRAQRLGSEAQQRVLREALGDRSLDQARADAVRQVVVDTGALASVEALLASEHARALAAIESLPADARSALSDLAHLAIERAA